MKGLTTQRTCVDKLILWLALLLTHKHLSLPLSLSLSLSLFPTHCLPPYQSPDKPYKIHGNILVFVERMDEEFTKVLQATDPHSTDFVTKYVTLFQCDISKTFYHIAGIF